MKIIYRLLLPAMLLMLSSPSSAADDLVLQKITDQVYAIVGELGNRTPQNLGNNATFGFVVTSGGVVLIDSGGSYKGAQRLHEVIKSVTDKPIVTVINSGGQDHRWLGNGYFRQQGARVIASEAAVADQRARARDQMILLNTLVGEEGLEGTVPSHADDTFSDSHRFSVGETRFEIYHAGAAHTPGDSFIWLPQQRVMFSGDIVYIGRMLGVGAQSDSASWVSVYETMAGYAPDSLVPGHGHAATLQRATADTYDYLVFLRSQVRQFFDTGGDIANIGSLDQSRFSYLENFDTLAGEMHSGSTLRSNGSESLLTRVWNMPDDRSNDKLDRVVAEARRARETREQGYRERALKMYPWVCGRCAREFTRANLHELTVHHRDHNHDNNPPDGSNWELLCLYCHDNEHSRYIDAATDERAEEKVATHNPFADLADRLKEKP